MPIDNRIKIIITSSWLRTLVFLYGLVNRHVAKARTQHKLALIYSQMGLRWRAELHLADALANYEQSLGKNHYETEACYKALRELFLKLEQHDKPEQDLLRILSIAERKLGSEHEITIEILHELAYTYSNLGLQGKAEELFLKALEASEQVLGPQSITSLFIRIRLGHFYEVLGNYNEAEHLYLWNLRYCEQVYGEEHPMTEECLRTLGWLYLGLSDYDQSELFMLRGLAITKKRLGSEHIEIAERLEILARVVRLKNDYGKAQGYEMQALAIRRIYSGKTGQDVADTLLRLASDCVGQNLLTQAESWALQALDIQLEILDKESSIILNTLTILMSLCASTGRYSKAMTYERQALNCCERCDDLAVTDKAKCFFVLSRIYLNQGLMVEAGSLSLRALNILEQQISELMHAPTMQHDVYTVECCILALNANREISLFREDYENARVFGERSLAITKKIYGKEGLSTAREESQLGFVYFLMGNEVMAEKLLLNAISIMSTNLGCSQVDSMIAETLTYLAYHKCKNENYESAKGYALEALGILERYSELDTRKRSLAELALAGAYLGTKDYSKCYSLARDIADSEWEFIRRELPLMPARSRLVCYKTSLDVSRRFAFKLAAHFEDAVLLALEVRLQHHGLMQEIERRHFEIRQTPASDGLRLDRLAELAMIQANVSHLPLNRSDLRNEYDDLEREFVSKYPDLQLQACRISDVAASLPSNGALIEIERVESINRYIAIILLANGKVNMIDLGSASELDDLIIKAINATSGGLGDGYDLCIAVSHHLVQPLMVTLKGIHRWFLSLDGSLHRLPFSALPWPGSDGDWLSEMVELTLLSSGRDLLRLQHKTSVTGQSLVVANPKYDLSATIANSISEELQAKTDERLRSSDMLMLGNWSPLPGSTKEGYAVARLLGARLLMESEATVVNLQRVERPRILHIATHGYFLHVDVKTESIYSDFCREILKSRSCVVREDSMLRSGLVLAGANHPDANPDDDGYLTAMEAAHLDLQGTELVTLSACETGCGEIQVGEGVYGLQRALIIAGARSMLLSLWKVPDDATCAFMVHFYTLLKQGLGRREALVEVQRAFREHSNPIWRDSSYWAAWQLIGDWRPIEGL